jgi:hypothetical protein
VEPETKGKINNTDPLTFCLLSIFLQQFLFIFFKKHCIKAGRVVHTYNPSIWDYQTSPELNAPL